MEKPGPPGTRTLAYRSRYPVYKALIGKRAWLHGHARSNEQKNKYQISKDKYQTRIVCYLKGILFFPRLMGTPSGRFASPYYHRESQHLSYLPHGSENEFSAAGRRKTSEMHGIASLPGKIVSYPRFEIYRWEWSRHAPRSSEYVGKCNRESLGEVRCELIFYSNK